MEQTITNYSFNASAKTIDLSSIVNFDIKRLRIIINLTAGITIYVGGNTGMGYSAVSGSTVTLQVDTTAMSNTDNLTVIYDSPDSLGIGSGVLIFTSSAFISVTTTGTTYAPFGSLACDALQIDNTDPAAVAIEVQKGGTGGTIKIAAGGTRYFAGITNANQLSVRRADTSSTSVTVSAEAIVK
jgi:hypothetical protein